MELETIHLVTLGVTAVAILYADHLGFAYIRGKRETLERKLVERLHYVVSLGLSLMIISGVLLAIPRWEYLLVTPLFYVKMWFVLVLVLNGWAIGSISRLSSDRSYKELPISHKRTLLVSGALSFLGWVGAGVIGSFFL